MRGCREQGGIRGQTRDGAVTPTVHSPRMPIEDLLDQEITGEVIAAFYDVYRELGFGFLEHVYALAMERELITRGRQVGREVSVQIRYKGTVLTSQRIDMIVDEKVVVEIKSASMLPMTAERQTLNYLRSSNLEVGLRLHFGPTPKFYRLICSHRGHRHQSTSTA